MVSSGVVKAPSPSKAKRVQAFPHERLKARLPLTAQRPDVVASLSANTIQRFLDQHYDNNPDFYDRSRTSGHGPLFEQTFNDHGTQRLVRMWAKVDKAGPHPVAIDLTPAQNVRTRFGAWWTKVYGKSVSGEIPHNVTVNVPRVIVQIEFPKLDGTGGVHNLDLSFRIEVQAFLKLINTAGSYELQMVNWDLAITGLSDPMDPNDPIWGKPPAPGCAQEVMRLRLELRDIVALGANIALTQLASTLVVHLPFPSIDIVKGFSLVPQNMMVDADGINVSLVINRIGMHAAVNALFDSRMAAYNNEVRLVDVGAILAEAPDEPTKFERYLRSKIPAYKALSNEYARNVTASRVSASTAHIPAAPRNPDLAIALDSSIFDGLAKALLQASSSGSSEWFALDVGAGYFSGTGRYWFNVSGGHGSIVGTTINMGASLDAGGVLDLRACVRIPCHSDECGTWSPGFGLSGPADVAVTFSNMNWNKNKALRLTAQFNNVPGLVVYGLPPVISDIANKVLNYISSIALKSFMNAIIAHFSFYLIDVPESLGHANVKATIGNFGASNYKGFLIITGDVAFS